MILRKTKTGDPIIKIEDTDNYAVTGDNGVVFYPTPAQTLELATTIGDTARTDVIYELLKHFGFACPDGEQTPVCDLCGASPYCIELRTQQRAEQARKEERERVLDAVKAIADQTDFHFAGDRRRFEKKLESMRSEAEGDRSGQEGGG